MPRIRITFDADSAAFQDDMAHEMQVLLTSARQRLCDCMIDDNVDETGGEHVLALRDSNGNRCGWARLEQSR